jgi:hypothetical protein
MQFLSSINKSKWRKIVCAVLFTAGSTLGVWAWAQDDGRTVSLRIEGETDTLYMGELIVGDCTVSDTTGEEHFFSGKAGCALEASGVPFELENSAYGLYLRNIDGENTDGKYWSFWVNYDYSMIGIADYDITGGEELLLAFTLFDTEVPLRVSVDSAVAEDGREVEIRLQKSGAFEGWAFVHGFSPADGAVLKVDNMEIPVAEDGTTRLALEQGVHNISAS